MASKKKIEAAQQAQLMLHSKKFWLPNYPELRVTHISIKHWELHLGSEKGHPDLMWRYKYAGHYYFLYHELKTSKGSLNDNQIEWWAEFEPTEFVKGKVTYGWKQHLEAVRNWLKDFSK